MSDIASTTEELTDYAAVLARFRQIVAERGPPAGDVTAQIEALATIAMEAEGGACSPTGRGLSAVIRMIARVEEIEAVAQGIDPPPWLNASGLSNALRGGRALSSETLRRFAHCAGLELGFRLPTVERPR